MLLRMQNVRKHSLSQVHKVHANPDREDETETYQIKRIFNTAYQSWTILGGDFEKTSFTKKTWYDGLTYLRL